MPTNADFDEHRYLATTRAAKEKLCDIARPAPGGGGVREASELDRDQARREEWRTVDRDIFDLDGLIANLNAR